MYRHIHKFFEFIAFLFLYLYKKAIIVKKNFMKFLLRTY